jgi:hypothetical protein
MVPKRIAEAFVEVKRYYWLWKLVEVSAQNVGSIMNCIACPVESFAIAIR